MTEHLSFKATLKDEENGGKDEKKRFVMRKDVSTSFSDLREKICSVFPHLMDVVIIISWTDEEGDMITIGTDEELAIALEGMPGPIYKLFVSVKGKIKANTSAYLLIHYGVTCDACGLNPINGKRYKCVICADYDLCGSCKNKNIHSGHEMRLIGKSNIQSDCVQACPKHHGITCDLCGKTPIEGIRYKCTVCDDYDLCEQCKGTNQHPEHNFMKIDTPRTLPFGLFSPININKVQEMTKKQSKSGRNSSQISRYGVTCDVCEKTPIVGHRYKCSVCADYDLCETCKADGRHPGHKMNLVDEHFNKIKKHEVKTGSTSHHGLSQNSKSNGNVPRHDLIKSKNSKQFSSLNAIKRQIEALAKIEMVKNKKDIEKKLEYNSTLPTNSSPEISFPSIPECPVCLEDLKPPLKIFNCRNGHLICSVCKLKVDICTNCREEYTGRATAIEQMLREMFN